MSQFGINVLSFPRLLARLFNLDKESFNKLTLPEKDYIAGYILYYQGSDQFRWRAEDFKNNEGYEIEYLMSEALRGWMDAKGDEEIHARRD